MDCEFGDQLLDESEALYEGVVFKVLGVQKKSQDLLNESCVHTNGPQEFILLAHGQSRGFILNHSFILVLVVPCPVRFLK